MARRASARADSLSVGAGSPTAVTGRRRKILTPPAYDGSFRSGADDLEPEPLPQRVDLGRDPTSACR